MQITEKMVLSAFVLPELLILFGILWADLWYKSYGFKKREGKTKLSPWLVSALLVLLSFGVSLVFNYLMYALYFAQNPSENLWSMQLVNSVVVILTMGIILFNLEPKP